MAECEVCGREQFSGYSTDGERHCDTVSDRGVDSTACYRLGYQRENARADAMATDAARLLLTFDAESQAKLAQTYPALFGKQEPTR